MSRIAWPRRRHCRGMGGGHDLRAQPGLLLLVVAVTLAGPAPLTEGRDDTPTLVATPRAVVRSMLVVGDVRPGDVVYDLGCGDARIVIAAVRIPGVRGVCVEIDGRLIREGRRLAAAAGVADRIRFVQGDMFEVPLQEATLVTLFLEPELNLRLRPRLLSELRPGTRIVSHSYGLGDWEPQERVVVDLAQEEHVIYRWLVPPPAAPAAHLRAAAPCPAAGPSRCGTTPRSSR
jgi:SAM-dependent methyltransferase